MTSRRQPSLSSSFFSFFFFLLALVTTLPSSNVEAAISCQPWIGLPEACASYIPAGSIVYVPDNVTQVDLLMSAVPALTGLGDLAAVPRCQLAYLEFICLTTFPLCHNSSRIGTAYDYTELRPTCREACDPVVRFCAGTLTALGRGSEIPDCQGVYSSPSVYADKAVYPTSSWRWNITTPDTVVPCHDVEAPPVQCPPHYSYVDDLDVPIPCLPSCPAEVYTDTEYTAQYAVLTTGGGLSVIAGAFVLPPYLLRPERWRWPQQMNIWIITCNWLIASSHVIPLILNGNDWEGVVCEDDTTVADVNHPLCGIQGLWITYFAWAGFMWWFGACMNLALTVQRIELDTRVQCILWHFTSWGVALLPIIIAASNDEIGGGSGVECGYTGSNEGWIMQSVFWIPILLLWLIGGLALVFVIVELLRLEGIKGILGQLRLLLFTVSSLWPVIYGAAFFYSIRAQIDDISYDLARWFVCVATSPDEDVCDKYRNPPNYGASMVGTINTGWMQLLWILIFGISPTVWNWWRHLIVNVVKCRWKALPTWWDKMDSSSSSSSIGGPTVFNRAQRGGRQNRVGRKPIKPVQGTHRPSLDRT